MVDGECGTCGEFKGEDPPGEECPDSQRPCGHHCNCSWIHDCCHWCGAEFCEFCSQFHLPGKHTQPKEAT